MSDPAPAPVAILEVPPAERNDRLRADLAWSLPALKRLLAASTHQQEEILEFRERHERLPASTPLAPRSLRQLEDGRSTYLETQGRLIALARRYQPLLGPDAADLVRLRIDPVLRARAVLVSFVASLTVFDNYLAMRSVLEDARLRRLIADPLRGYGMREQEVVDVLEDLNSARNQRRLRELVGVYDRFSDALAAAEDPDIDFLRAAVAANAAYGYAQQATLGRRMPTTPRRWREKILDVLDGLGKSTIGTLSEVFGNGIGLVEVRKGKLWGDAAVERRVLGRLRPLDLLLEKTPFRLTDKFIPGHFGHVALWVGTAAELDDLAIFEDPLFREPRFQACEAAVREGRSVLEALRTGVQLSTLAEFLNVDDLAILRPQGLSPAETRDSLLRAFRQVGKQYDFNFEVETLDELACSELPYHVFPDIPWETEAQLGQHTISPDQVAEQALGEDASLQLVEFVHDGRLVPVTEALPRMQALVESAES